MKRSWSAGFVLMITLCLALVVPARAEINANYGFESGNYQDQTGNHLLYRLLKPENPKKPLKYPLILFLHGSWEDGQDNTKQLLYIGRDITNSSIRKRYPAFVLAPQCPKGQNWVANEFFSGTRPQSKEPTKVARLTFELIKELERKYPIDPNRIYITGVSSGGFGTWDFITRQPSMFAAAAPFSGGGDVTKVERITKVPIWAFHSTLDVVTHVSCTRNMIHALKKVGGHPRYTEFNSPRHDCWGWEYKDPEFYQWIFAQRRNFQ